MTDPASSIRRTEFAARCVLAVGAVVAAVFALHPAFREIGAGPGPEDKLLHLAAYAPLTVLAILAFPRLAAWRVAAGVMAASALVECAQAFTGRQFSKRDLVANLIAVAVGYGAVWSGRRWARARAKVQP
jgi:hypothetical protein